MGIQEKEALRGLVEGILTVMQSAAGRLVPGWEANEVRWVGLKDHERSEYRLILERQEFVVRNGARRNGG